VDSEHPSSNVLDSADPVVRIAETRLKSRTPTPEFGEVAISAERESNSYIGRRHGLEAKPEAQSLLTTSTS